MKDLYSFRKTLGLVSFSLITFLSRSQCGAGETALYLNIATDQWGYECYWQVTPLGNACDVGTIDEGGNLAQVGCNGAGQQDATTAQGYADYASISEGPICLTIGESYTLHYIDDYSDGGATFELELFGFPLLNFTGMGDNNEFDFTVVEPLLYDVAGEAVQSFTYVQPGDIPVSCQFFTRGSETITSVEFSYQVNGGQIVVGQLDGLSILPFTSFNLVHPQPWNELNTGEYTLDVWISAINGNADMNTANDIASRLMTVGPGIPNILDDYMAFMPEIEQIAGSGQSINEPRDLDFHPVLTRKELWVVLKSTENSGGKTVKISNAGEGTQDELLQQDGNAWHFMSLPTGIAFSRNENFATSPGVYDANHDGGAPFTGPALWSSDPDIYAQPSGGNGSHLDMLHESPYSMGIAAEVDNKFWVTCGDHNEIMSFDFQHDHGPGNSDHSDGIIYKYPIPGYSEDAAHEIPDHLVFDANTGWLYACNSQQNRVIRINTNTGTPGDDATPHEATSVYKYMDNFTWEEYITDGLDAPTGIDIVEDRMIVSNYNTGDIQLYDISGSTPLLLTTIPTGDNGIMGVKVGPDGFIWYVNKLNDTVMRVGLGAVTVKEKTDDVLFSISPNPANQYLNVGYSQIRTLAKAEVQILDMSGRVILTEVLNSNHSTRLDISFLANGVYNVLLKDNSIIYSNEKLVIQK